MSIVFNRDVPCTLRDGVILRANVYAPSQGGPYPVVLSRLPYGKDSVYSTNLVQPIRLAEAGYIVVVQDVRGTFASQGELGGFDQEFEDGFDTVMWASQLENSNGEVGMFGLSYYGWTQLAAATMHPAPLKTIVPVFPLTDSYTTNHRQGALEWGLLASWTLSMAPAALLRRDAANPDMPRDLVGLIRAIDNLPVETYLALPVSTLAPVRNHDLLRKYLSYMDLPANHPEWGKLTVLPQLGDLMVSAYVIGGWYDIFLPSALAVYTKMQRAGKKARLLIGPWTHTGRMQSFVGELDFGLAANGNSLNLREDTTALHQRWFDAELKGIENGLQTEPPVMYFVMGENRWHSAKTWPLPETVYTKLYLHSGGRANTSAGDGKLSTQAPQSQVYDVYTYNPLNPVPTVGGNTLMSAAYPPGPFDQRRLVESRADVLVYTSDVLEVDVEVTGQVTATLWVTSDAPTTDFVVRLVDVYPDGRSINVVDGIARVGDTDAERAHLNHSLGANDALEVTIDCLATSIVFLKGHQMRVHVTSSSFPRWNRNLNTGSSNEHSVETRPAAQRLYHDAERPTHLTLPVIPRNV